MSSKPVIERLDKIARNLQDAWAASATQHQGQRQALGALASAVEDLTAEVRGLVPLTVPVDADLALRVVQAASDRLAVPDELAALWREMAQYGPWRYCHPIGGGAVYSTIQTEVGVDGTMELTLFGPNQERLWRGTFHGVSSCH